VTDLWLDFTKGEKAYCHLGGNSTPGQFFRGRKDGPEMIFPRGKFCTRPIFPGGKSNPGSFFRRESLSGGKGYGCISFACPEHSERILPNEIHQNCVRGQEQCSACTTFTGSAIRDLNIEHDRFI
jgi:hypothetical protein